MNRRTKIILIFASILVSLIIIVVMYYGVDRYLSLKMSSNKRAQKLIENYTKLSPSSDSRTVITFASKDDHDILPTVLSLLDQTVRVDQIALNSCLKKAPSDTCLKAINVFRVSPKTEQFQGIVPTLEREKYATTNIIWLRDDYIYGKDFIELLFDERKQPTQSVIAKNSKGKIIGILLQPNSLTTNIIDYEKSCVQTRDCNSIDKILDYLKKKPLVITSMDSYKV